VPTVVQKFGGTSVADAEKIRRCAQRAFDARQAGRDVVVVVSAMGKTTDGLIDLAHEISPSPPQREMDQLLAAGEQVSIALTAMALQELGHEAVSLTGAQCGLQTDASFTRARIQSIDRQRIERHLSCGKVVVVAGFQGVDDEGSITTLGRGGSDTSAVALAAALEAEVCEIFTDVPGVLTADPRLVPHARKLDQIAYEEMFELAALGATVMAPRAILLAMKFDVPIHVRHAMLPDTGTMIVPETPALEQNEVTGVALKNGVGRVTIQGLPNRPGIQADIFDALAAAQVLVDDIIQNRVGEDRMTITFTADGPDLARAQDALRGLIETIGGEIRVDTGLCRVSAVGVGMRTQSGVAARMFRSLGSAPDGPINIENITTSEIKIACILAEADGPRAVIAVHDAFDLGEPAS
jgi:aspartate kinase